MFVIDGCTSIVGRAIVVHGLRTGSFRSHIQLFLRFARPRGVVSSLPTHLPPPRRTKCKALRITQTQRHGRCAYYYSCRQQRKQCREGHIILHHRNVVLFDHVQIYYYSDLVCRYSLKNGLGTTACCFRVAVLVTGISRYICRVASSIGTAGIKRSASHPVVFRAYPSTPS